MKTKLSFAAVLFLYLLSLASYSEYSNENKVTHLEALISSNDEIRKSALLYLYKEFSYHQSEPRYQYYGDELLSYLVRVINNLEDKYARHALKAIYQMSIFNEIKLRSNEFEKNKEYNEEFKELISKYNHYPNPLEYKPIKEALIKNLEDNPDHKSQSLAARTLIRGFTPIEDIEHVLLSQLLREKNRKTHNHIINGIQYLSNKQDYVGEEVLPVFHLDISYSHKYGSGHIRQTFIANQPLRIGGHNWNLKFTFDSLTEKKYLFNYEIYGEEYYNHGAQEGVFGDSLEFNFATKDNNIESTLVIEYFPECLKRYINSCHLEK